MSWKCKMLFYVQIHKFKSAFCLLFINNDFCHFSSWWHKIKLKMITREGNVVCMADATFMNLLWLLCSNQVISNFCWLVFHFQLFKCFLFGEYKDRTVYVIDMTGKLLYSINRTYGSIVYCTVNDLSW